MPKMLVATALALVLAPFATLAQQSSPLGRWTTLDDESGRPMTVVEVYQAQNGTLAARIVENIAAPATCSRCSGNNRNKPIIGMNVLWNLRRNDGVWGDGNGLKPSTGDTFRVRSIELIEAGRKLRVTGCKGPFCRSAIWERR